MVRRCLNIIFQKLPFLGLVKTSNIREQGISALMRVKNEVDWIELSVLSIKDFVDEIIIVDSSTDSTTQIIKKLANKYDNIHWFYLPEENIVKASNLALMKSNYQWILKWDADYIAKDSIRELRQKIMNLGQNTFYFMNIPFIHLRGDLYHQLRQRPIHIEQRAFTWSPKLKYIQAGRFEQVVGSRIWGKRLPLYYKEIPCTKIYAFHCDIKPARRMLFRRFWTDWMELGDYVSFPRLEDYVKYRIRKEWNVKSFEEAEKIVVTNMIREVVPYDKKKFGEYPNILRTRLKNPRYRLIYKGGKIIGRIEPGKTILVE